MLWAILLQVMGFGVDLFVGARGSEHAKDPEIALRRHQLRLLQRRAPRPPRLARWEKLTLAVLAAKLGCLVAGSRRRLSRAVLLVQPETVLRWHRELVRWKWTYRRPPAGGRPPIGVEVEAPLLRLAKENPRWGDGRLQGELLKLGHTLGRSTIRDVLKRRRVPPAPRRRERGDTWRQFLARHRDAALVCDCFTVETVFLKTLSALFFLEIGTRRVHFAGGTAHPTAAWVTQQARDLAWTLHEGGQPVRYLIHDRDATFPPSFDLVFAAEGVEVIRRLCQKSDNGWPGWSASGSVAPLTVARRRYACPAHAALPRQSNSGDAPRWATAPSAAGPVAASATSGRARPTTTCSTRPTSSSSWSSGGCATS